MLGSTINLTKILIDSKKITSQELERALLLQKKLSKPLKEVLIKEKFITEEELISVTSCHLGIPFIDLSKFRVEPEIFKLIPEHLARKYCLLPLYKSRDALLIAIAEPLDIIALDNLRLLAGCEIEQVLCKEKLISEHIENYYSGTETLTKILDYDKALDIVSPDAAKELDSENLIRESEEQPIVRAVDFILNEAIAKRASDIHVEPVEEGLLVRYRVDGILHEVHSLSRKSQRGICARLKILSGLNITKSFIPQDGRFHANIQKRDIDFRVSSLPTVFGEKFVLRVLDKSSIVVKLSDLGFSPQPLSLLKEAVVKDHGMILITGPTGSGKSTTLYAILAELNTVYRHIVTVEEPVEYQLDGITQVHVKPEIELTFAAALRGLLRQTPDTIMVGEIRDSETADIAIKASLIGQLIFSTLHTNDAIGAFARLIDMGIERYLVASSLILICAQRLARKICPECKEPLKSLSKDIIKGLNLEEGKEYKFYHGVGCQNCNHSGYLGRVALLEALKVDEQIRSMVIKEVSLEEIKEWALKENRLVTLRNDGLSKAASGITTVEEIYRTTVRD